MARKKHELTKNLKFQLGENEIIIFVKMAFVKSVQKWGAMRDAYSVVISYGDEFITSKYHKSAYDFNHGNRDIDKDDIADALYAICTDAMAYCDYPYFDDFHANFGSNYKAFETCKRLYDDLYSLFGSDEWIVAIGEKADDGDYEIVKIEDEK